MRRIIMCVTKTEYDNLSRMERPLGLVNNSDSSFANNFQQLYAGTWNDAFQVSDWHSADFVVEMAAFVL